VLAEFFRAVAKLGGHDQVENADSYVALGAQLRITISPSSTASWPPAGLAPQRSKRSVPAQACFAGVSGVTGPNVTICANATLTVSTSLDVGSAAGAAAFHSGPDADYQLGRLRWLLIVATPSEFSLRRAQVASVVVFCSRTRSLNASGNPDKGWRGVCSRGPLRSWRRRFAKCTKRRRLVQEPL
jgi:hypothetical protein